MNGEALPLAATARAAWPRRFAVSVPGRILIFLVFAAAIGFPLAHATRALGWTGKSAVPALGLLGAFIRHVVPTVGAYLLLVRLVERRRPDELLSPRLARQAATGLGLALALMGSVMLVLWLAGAWTVTGFNADAEWLEPLVVTGLAAGIGEEIVFRGVLFRITEDALGTWPALAISALLFGGVHSWNPNATLWSSFAIAVEAGVLLGVVYHVWRSLPVCIGLHMGWNFIEGAVLGSAVSGVAQKGWIASRFGGPDWLSGGAFGIEASVVTVAASLALSAVLLARRRPTRAGGKAC